MSVGLVIVSHHEKIAEGLQELMTQAAPSIKVAAAGGTDEGELGTSAIRIKTHIESVISEDGVIILFDIGSARMNTELALELIGEPENVIIADAPLVEGAYVAAVEAGMGKTLEEVHKAVEDTRGFKKIID